MQNKDEHLDADPTSPLTVYAFALTDCTIEIEAELTKYLRAVHRTALELAVPNLFGVEIGGFWLTSEQVSQLRRLPECYPANEIQLVRRAVETYLRAQTLTDARASTASAG
jgi:hypothetical protein